MPTITAADVDARLSTLLTDPDRTRWTLAERLLWMADAQREIGAYKPDAFNQTAVMALAAGTKQTLPADGLTLVNVVRNMGADSQTPGRSPRLVSQAMLDAQLPGWHKSPPNAEVRHFAYDPANQKVLWVYPPQPASGQGSLEIIYSAIPGALTQLTDAFVLDAIYLSAITNYVLYRAWSKDAEYAGNANLAAAYYQAFLMQVGGKAAAESMTNPNVRNETAPNPPA